VEGKATVELTFESFQIDHLALQGHQLERASVLRRFGAADGPTAMLLSMASSPSGLNLPMANHVTLVQPTWHGESHEKSVDFQDQAVGRCWRTGQQRAAHIWRLCTVGIVDEDVVEGHNGIFGWSCNVSLAYEV